MVKKTSLLEKLFGSRRTADRKRATAPKRGGGETPVAAKERDVPASGGGNGGGNGGSEAGLTKSRARREEAGRALTDGFKNLSTLLEGIQERMEDQGARAGELNDKFADLPTMAQAQVDFMGKISEQMLAQKDKTGELLDKLGNLPELLGSIGTSLERQVKNEERTEQTLEEFRSTMDRIHDSIGTLSRDSREAVRDATQSFERTQGRTVRVFEDTQRKAFATFEKTQAAQMKQLSSLIDRSGRMNRGIVFLLVLVFAALVTLFAIVLTSG